MRPPEPDSPHFTAYTLTRAGESRLLLSGELDSASLPQLERRLDELSNGDARLIVLDLRGVRFNGDRGIRAIRAFAERESHRIGVVQGSPRVHRSLELDGDAGTGDARLCRPRAVAPAAPRRLQRRAAARRRG